MRSLGVVNKQSEITSMISDAILGGALEPGAEIVQSQLADTLGVSRMPVREALIVLEFQGLVRRLPNSHCVILDVAGDALDGALDTLAALEALAMRRCTGPLCHSELAFHDALVDALPEGLASRTLRSAVDVFVSFAMRSDAHDPARAFSMLEDAVSAHALGDHAGCESALRAYTDCLKEDILSERRA